jgi:hypothetical protein
MRPHDIRICYVGTIRRGAMLCIAHVAVSPADEIVDGSSSRRVCRRRAEDIERSITRSPSGRSLCRRDVDRELAVTVSEGRGVDLLELDRAAHHALLPGVVLGVILEFRHHFLAE